MMKVRQFTLFASCLFALNFVYAQQITQTIKGSILDKQSKETLIGANAVLLDTQPSLYGTSDENGNFKIVNVPVGRYNIKVTYIGYKDIIIPNVQLTAGKEVSLDIELEESATSLNEVVISGTKKNETNNELASVSGRSFSMEEVNRYAGGRSDPSRLAANFAGVSSPDDSRNDIVIRGNSPTGVLWRIEGLNIPNPNHFSTVGTTGGPVSAINTNVLKNSDFFTSAFPAEYGNANAGVFDLGFRNGNADKYEHTIQLGALTGVEGTTEGPINKSKGSSYLIAYRYSFTGFAQQIGIPIGTAATPFYQDLSFKINSGYSKYGKFTLFGLGGKSKIDFKHDEIDSTDLFANPTRDSYFKSDIAIAGLKHFIRMGKKSYFKTIIGVTYSKNSFLQDTISKTKEELGFRITENAATQIRYSVNTSFNSKISSKLFVKAGIIEELINLDLNYRDREFTADWNQIWDYKDQTSLLQAYAHAKITPSDKLTINLGVHSQYLQLSEKASIEPRAGIKYQIDAKNSLSAGYGLNSQMQPLDVLFYRAQNADGTYDQSNKNLDFTKSHHFVIGYDLLPAADWRIKMEAYYQYLYNIPVTANKSSFSMLNTGSTFGYLQQGNLENKGTGTNYGLELTIEKFFTRGYYGLLTGTLYDSKYKGSDGQQRNTAFNGKFVYNVLLGKEFKIGKSKRNAITADVKMTQAGGRFYTPVDIAASQMARREILQGDAAAFSERNPDFFRLDVKIGVTFNSKTKKLSQSLFFDIQNVTNNKNVFAQRYNPVTNNVNTAYQLGLFPNFLYRLQF
ncbi:MAG: TonB-dependent receptor [Saprospiraceae bacterium]